MFFSSRSTSIVCPNPGICNCASKKSVDRLDSFSKRTNSIVGNSLFGSDRAATCASYASTFSANTRSAATWSSAACRPVGTASSIRSNCPDSISPSSGTSNISRSPSVLSSASTFLRVRNPLNCSATERIDFATSSSWSGVLISTAMIISAPIARTVSIGRLLAMPPSTSIRSPQATGDMIAGIDMLARIAFARFPESSTTFSPVRISAATARNGIPRSSKSSISATCSVSAVRRLLIFWPCTRPGGNLIFPSL